LVVHPDTAPSKCWPVPRFIELLDRFLSRRCDFIVWVVGLPYGPLDVGRHAQRIVNCAGLPLDVTMALVSRADFFLGVDSCVLHAADFFRIPGVGLFGPTSSTEWGFRIAPHRHLCGSGSLDSITVDAVLEALEDLIGDSAVQSSAAEA
jgi:ADP-heptose:LPS heptosyltransferase